MASTFDANAVDMGTLAIQSNDPLVKKITYSLFVNNNLVQDIPMVTRQTLLQNGVRFVGNLPGVNWVPMNKPGVITKGVPTPYQEQMWLLRNQFQVDAVAQNDENTIMNPLDLQVEAWLKAFTYAFNNTFINNNHLTGDVNAPVGLRARLDQAAEFGNAAEMKIDAGGVDLSSANISQATSNAMLELMDQLLDFLGAPDGEGVVLYANDYLMRKINRAGRQAGPGAGFDTSKDAFDRVITTYRGARLRSVGRKADQSTRVISQTETSAGLEGSSNFTSLYGVLYGLNSFCGWQNKPLKPKSLGLDPTNGVAYNTIIDWGLGLWQANTRSVGRIYDIKIS